jgi:hypothetical protein
MGTNLKFSCILLMASVLASCEMGSCVRGEGKTTRTVLAVGPFEKLVLKSSIDVRLIPGEVQHVEIEGQANLAELVTTQVEDGIWTIAIDECYRSKGPFVVHLTTPTLDAITIQGSGDVQSTGPLRAETLELRIQGSGDMRVEVAAEHVKATVQGSGDVFLSGSTTTFETRVQGSGDVRAGELAAQDVKASVMGSGDIALQCNGVLDASIMGSGDIAYRGAPTGVFQNIKGSGSIRAVE